MSRRGHKSKLNAKMKRLIKRYELNTGTKKLAKGGNGSRPS